MRVKRPEPATRLAGLLLACLLPAASVAAQAVDPMRAPVRTAPEPALDLLHVAGDIDVADSGAWTVRVAATARVLADTTDSVEFAGMGVRIDSVAVAPAAEGDTTLVRLAYHVPVGIALRSSGEQVWTWTRRTGGASWLPFDAADRFTAHFRFTGADLVVGGVRTEAGGDTTAVEYPEPLSTDHLLFVAGRPGATVRSGRFVFEAPAGSDVAPFAATFRSAWAFFGSLTGFLPPVDTVRVAFADVGAGRSEAGYGIALADLSLLDPREAFETAVLAARSWSGVAMRPAAWTDLWLTEAIARHLALRFVRETRGEGAEWAALQDLRSAYLEESRRYRRPLVWDRWNRPSDLADAHAAGRGAWVLRQLEHLLGEETVLRALHALFVLPRDPYTEDFQAALEGASGRDLGDFFDAWVGGAGHPVVRMDTRFDVTGERLRVSFEQVQDGPFVPGVFPVDTRLVWSSLAGDGSGELRARERSTVVDLPIRLDPRFVEPDPDGAILMELESGRDLSARTAALQYGTLPTRYRAARAAAEVALDPALPLALRLALEQEPEPVVRRAIVQAAARVPHSSSGLALARRGLEDPDPTVRVEALRVLSGYGDRPDLSALVEGIASRDTVHAVQAQAVETLAAMRAADADYFARAALITESEHDVVRAAGFRALVALGTPHASLREEFLDHSRSDRPVSRILAALAIADRLESDRPVSRRIRELLRHPHWRVREAAARAAGAHLPAADLESARDAETDAGVVAALSSSIRFAATRRGN